MTIGSFEILFYTITFLLPGYIIRAMLSYLLPNKVEKLKHLAFVRLLTYGAVNFVVAMIVVSAVAMVFPDMGNWVERLFAGEGTGEAVEEVLSGSYLLMWVGVLFVQPAILGVIWAKINDWERITRIANWAGFRPELCDDAAWDYTFRRIQDETYVLVTLEDDTEVYGRYSNRSYASSSSEERDLFLEEVLKETWESFEEPSEIWLKGEEIKSIEFLWPIVEESEDERDKASGAWNKLRRYLCLKCSDSFEEEDDERN